LTEIGKRSLNSMKGLGRLTGVSSFRRDSTTGEWSGTEAVFISFATAFSIGNCQIAKMVEPVEIVQTVQTFEAVKCHEPGILDR
jgi:hypothetical protein